MTRQRLFPSDPFTMLRRAVDRAFEDFPLVNESPFFRTSTVFPTLNLWEDPENLYVEAEIPGIKSEDLEISAVGRQLSIRGRRNPFLEEKVVYHRQERGAGEFARVIELPSDVDAGKIQATLKDGVLTVTLPKAPTAKAQKISVKAV